MKPTMLALALALELSAHPAVSAPQPLPTGAFTVIGRTAVVSLPYRSADNLVWVSATRMSEMAPFAFKGLEIRPRSGPGGTDLAVFTYQAPGPGAATLRFGLVPPGKMLIGPPTMVYKGPVAKTFEAKVAVK